MTLAEIAALVGVEPKWVLNTIAATGRPARYTVALARTMDVARAIREAYGVPVIRAVADADAAIRAHARGDAVVRIPRETSEVSLTLDMERLSSSFNVRLSALRTSFAPRQRGRHAADREPLEAAAEWGIDLTLLTDNLRKSAEQRIRQLDGMVQFARVVRRAMTPVR